MAETKNQQDTASHEEPYSELEGQVERITFASDETGYTVARVNVRGAPEPVTVVGNLMSPVPGEVLRMKGAWQTHPRFGRQFKVVSHSTAVPASIVGIRKYLGSGLVKGIGPVMARRIVDRFGVETLDVIENRREALLDIEGIGPKRVEVIAQAWREQKEIRDVMIFLQGHGVSTAFAARIFKKYGSGSIAAVSRNPYRLATEIFGIGFMTADRIAGTLGFEKNAPPRAEAGVLYVLDQLTAEGHVFYPYEPLVEKAREILEVDREVVTKAISSVALAGRVIVEDLNQDLDEYKTNHKAVYLRQLHTAETGIALHLARLFSGKRKIRMMDPERAVTWVQEKSGISFSERQMEAFRKALVEKVLVITGGPGTGKTTMIRALIKVLGEAGALVLLGAPTGRAAKRMMEATSYPARTIHRMLEYSLQKGGFQRNQDKPLEADVVILDEVSMIDTFLMDHFLRAVPSGAILILVGDVNQLPSVGPGNVLKDVIDSGAAAVVELKEIFRQARESRIIVNAHRINQGLLPQTRPGEGRLEDFYFIDKDDPDGVLETIMELVCDRVPKRFRLDPMEDIQVLSPMHKGVVGTENLNTRLQAALNPGEGGMTRGGRVFREKDRVMQIRNNYEKEVFNGDIGRISSIDLETRELVVDFDGAKVPYDASELDEIQHAYAISVHKSQGSEYPAVIMPILPQHYMLLQRNLLYTSVTRGKKLVVIVGSTRSLAMAVKNDKTAKRFTYLAERIKTLGQAT